MDEIESNKNLNSEKTSQNPSQDSFQSPDLSFLEFTKKYEVKVENNEIIVESSPLETADPESLDELFSRIDSCLKLQQIPSFDDIEKTVFALRQQRQKFLSMEAAKPVRSSEEKKSIAARTKATQKPIKSIKQALQISDL